MPVGDDADPPVAALSAVHSRLWRKGTQAHRHPVVAPHYLSDTAAADRVWGLQP